MTRQKSRANPDASRRRVLLGGASLGGGRRCDAAFIGW
jgi:hypothetical protein